MWHPSTIRISPESFAQIVNEQKLIVLHFWAGWNMYDQLMDRILEEIVPQYSDRIFFGAVDVDCPGHAQRCLDLRIVNVPALVVFVHGRHIETILGMRSQEDIRRRLEEWLAVADAV
jgi:thioredoxin-like negative regulator of GroEL